MQVIVRRRLCVSWAREFGELISAHDGQRRGSRQHAKGSKGLAEDRPETSRDAVAPTVVLDCKTIARRPAGRALIFNTV
jgi:hypothetical protein